ncbi:MAG: hypothetical protein AB8B55_17315 [Mariniblastus sp.]
MKQKTLWAFVVVFLACVSANLKAQQTPPGISYEQRIELAKKFLEPVREIAVKDQDSPERRSYFTGPMASIDPAWTMKFIIDNPVDQDGMLYDHSAKTLLASRANELDEEDLIQLIEKSAHLRYQYVSAALRSLPKEKEELRSQLVSIAMEEKEFNYQSIPSLIQIVNLADNPELSATLQARINEYYDSGKATEAVKMLKKRFAKLESWQKSNMRYAFGQLAASAPDKYRDEFLQNDIVTQYDVHWYIVLSDEFPTDLRLAELNKIKRFDFGKQTYEQMLGAGSLGLLAKIDLERALQWAKEAPHPAAKVWANLLIAPILAKTDNAAAVKLIRDCYRELSEMDASDRIPANYNFPPSLISCIGLQIVEQVDPDSMEQYIDQTILLAEKHVGSKSNSAQDQQFNAIVGVARYDREKALKMFDAIADDVKIHAAGSFFRALMALHPEQIWEEFETMPEKDSRGIDYRIQVRDQLMPAMTARTDSAFWAALYGSGFLKIDARILEE